MHRASQLVPISKQANPGSFHASRIRYRISPSKQKTGLNDEFRRDHARQPSADAHPEELQPKSASSHQRREWRRNNVGDGSTYQLGQQSEVER